MSSQSWIFSVGTAFIGNILETLVLLLISLMILALCAVMAAFGFRGRVSSMLPN